MHNYELLFYRYGDFAAKVMLSGMIHPDMQRSNIGFDFRGECKFCDYAEAENIEVPDDLNEERVRQLTESIFPLVDGIENSFLNCSYLRMGFLARGGVLAKEIFLNAINNGFSSALYVKHPVVKRQYDASKIYTDSQQMIREWKAIDVEAINLETYKTLEEYNNSIERKNTSVENKYYLDMSYFVRACLLFKDNPELKVPYATVLLNMALLAMNYNKPYTEYGLLKKCLKTYPRVQQIEEMCKGRLFSLLQSWDCNADAVEFIDEVIDQYDLFEFLWILDDVDVFNK